MANLEARLDQRRCDQLPWDSILDAQSHELDESSALILGRQPRFAFYAQRLVQIRLQSHRAQSPAICLSFGKDGQHIRTVVVRLRLSQHFPDCGDMP